MEVDALASLSPEALRAMLPQFLAAHVEGDGPRRRSRERVESLIESWTDQGLASALEEFATLGEEQRIYPAHPYRRALMRLWTEDVITQGRSSGLEHLAEAAERGPVAVLSNHLSYFDSTAIDAVVAWSGHAAIADRLVSAAGPKVYDDLFRRLATSCLNTLPVPQSSSLGHTAALSPRELARRAVMSLQAWRAGAEQGWLLLVYPEGSRTRTGRMGPFLKGVSRFLEMEDLSVVPLAIGGSDRIMPVGSTTLTPGPVSLTFGAPLHAADHASSRELLAAAHSAIARLLPADLAPAPDTPHVV